MGLAAASANLEWGECIVPPAPVPPALQAEVRKAVGAVPGWLERLAPSPWLVRALCEIIARPFAHAPLEICNQVALVVSQENSCRYCYGIQRAVLKIFGQRDEHIDALGREAQVGELTPAARAAFDGSPAAGVLRRAIDGAWASDVLPRRTKTLMLAVIARALDCAHGEQEARRFLAAEGLPPAELDDILANLGSPRLDAREALLVPFARETVRYQPAAMQRRMRELAKRLGPEEILEVVGIAALANAGCRTITDHRGHVAKFIGDGILALFGALEANPWQTNDAAHAALAMRAALADYDAALAADGLPALAMGVGIHRGTVVAGVIGSAELIEYGVIGSAVNLAARVQELTRAHAVDVLVTAAVRDALDPRFTLHAMPPLEVKGLPDPVATFAVDRFDAGTRPQAPATP